MAYVEDRLASTVRIDANPPFTRLESYRSGGSNYRANQYAQLAVTSLDDLSGAGQVWMERAFNGGGYSSPVSVALCSRSDGSAWCPDFDPPKWNGDGRYDLRFSSQDKAGNQENAGSAYTLLVDGSAPALTVGLSANERRAAPPDATSPGLYSLVLQGTVSDPNLTSGDPGSGLQQVQVTVLDANGKVAGLGTQVAKVEGTTWSVAYPFNVEPVGSFSLQVAAGDKVGNTTTVGPLAFFLDTAAPLAAVNPTSVVRDRILTNQTLNGVVTETPTIDGRFFGLSHLDAAFVPYYTAMYNDPPQSNGLVLNMPLGDLPNKSGVLSFADLAQGLRGVCGSGSCPSSGQPGHATTRSVSFPGRGEVEITIPGLSASNSLVNPGGEVTLAAWVWTPYPERNMKLFGTANLGIRRGYVLAVDRGMVGSEIWGSSGGYREKRAGAVPAKTWVHVAATFRRNGSLVIYLNGARVGENTDALDEDVGVSPQFIIGHAPWDRNLPLWGNLDDVRIYNRALSETELRALYDSTRSQGKAALIYSLDQNRYAAEGVTFSSAGASDQVATLHTSGDQNNRVVPGKVGNFALNLNGASDYLEAGNSLNLAGTSFSASFWARRLSSGKWHFVISQGSANQSMGLHIGFRDNDRFLCAFYNDDLVTDAAYTDSDWHQWACTFDAASQMRRIYRDGALVKEGKSSGKYWGTGPLYLGRYFNPEAYFHGMLDDIRLYGRALEAGEVLELYRMGWQNANLSASGDRVKNATWQFSIPTGLEGPYRLALRPADTGGNQIRTNEDSVNVEIDSLAPRGSFYRYYYQTNQVTHYILNAWDYNLAEKISGFDRCTLRPNLTYYTSPWYTAIFGRDTKRAFSLYAQCTVSGQSSDPASVQVCDTAGNCTTFQVTGSTPAEAGLPELENLSVWQGTPPDGSVVSSLPASLTVSGTLYASQYAQQLDLQVNNSPLLNQSWGQGDAITFTTWTTTWTPLADGQHLIRAWLQDWAGVSTTVTHTVYVDTDVPTLTLNTLPPQVWVDAAGQLYLSGVVTDAGGIASVVVDVSGPRSVTGTLASVLGEPAEGGLPWSAQVPLGQDPPLDGAAYLVTARVTDRAGRTAAITQMLTVDAAAPQVGEVALMFNGSPVTAGDRFTQPDLAAAGTYTVADGSGLVTAWYAWTDSPYQPLITDTRVLTVTPLAGNVLINASLSVTHTNDGQVRYLHYGAVDAAGYSTALRSGPFYHDLPEAPDYASLGEPAGPFAGQAYPGWKESGCSLVSEDWRTARTALPGGTLFEHDQALHVTRQAADLRLSWSGANWEMDGDLFIYLDTIPDTLANGEAAAYQRHGGNVAFNPYTTTQDGTLMLLPVNEWLPGQAPVTPTLNAMNADYAVWVQDSQTAVLLAWDEAQMGWMVSRYLSPTLETEDGEILSGEYRFSPEGDGKTDLLLPLAEVGITQTHSVVFDLAAFATEENALRAWAAAPSSNPLDSHRVVAEGAALDQPHRFMLTQVARINLGPGSCSVPSGRLDLEIQSTPAGANLSYTNDDMRLVLPRPEMDPGIWEKAFEPYATHYNQWLAETYCPSNQGALVCHAGQQPEDPLQLALAQVQGLDNPPLLPGQVVTYSIFLRNELPASQEDFYVFLSAEADKLDWPNDCPLVNLGALPLGSSAWFTLTATVNDSGVGWLKADLYSKGMLSEADIQTCSVPARTLSSSLGQAYVLYTTDNLAPVSTILPVVVLRNGVAAVAGYSLDETPLTKVEMQARAPGGSPTNGSCTIATASAWEWTCTVDTSQSGADSLELSVRTTDSAGHTSDWSPWVSAVIDGEPPLITAAASLSEKLGLPGVMMSGIFTDNRQVSAMYVCLGADDCRQADSHVDPAALPVEELTVEDIPETPLPIASGAQDATANGIQVADVCGPGTDGIWRSFLVTQTQTIEEVEVGLVISHTFRSNISARLWSPSGKQVKLIEPTGAVPAENYNLVLTDMAEELASQDWVDHLVSLPWFLEPRRPVESLRSLAGDPAAGTWVLLVCDLRPSPGAGSYLAGSLRLKYAPQAPQGGSAAWSFAMPRPETEALDNMLYPVTLLAQDAAGNLSEPVAVNLAIDNVAPRLSVLHSVERMLLVDTLQVLSGQVEDGSPSSVQVQVIDPLGNQELLPAKQDPDAPGRWSFDLRPQAFGEYVLYLLSADQGLNRTVLGPYPVQVFSGINLYLPWIELWRPLMRDFLPGLHMSRSTTGR